MEYFDKFYERKLKPGRYHYITLALCAAISVTIGVQSAVTAIIMPDVRNLYRLTDLQKSVQLASGGVGGIIGSVVGGQLADRIGRITTIRYLLIMQIGWCLFSLLVNNALTFELPYLFFNAYNAAQQTVVSSYLSENSFIQSRGRWLAFANIAVTLGRIMGTLLAMLILDEKDLTGWKLLSLSTVVLLGILTVAAFTFMKETTRFLFMKERYGEMQASFNEIVAMNNRGGMNCKPLSKKDVERLIEMRHQVVDRRSVVSAYEIFSKPLMFMNLMIWGVWICQAISFGGQMTIAPFGTNILKKRLMNILVIFCGELPAVVLAFLLIDSPSFGRRRSMIGGSAIAALLNFGSVVGPDSARPFLMFFARFFLRFVGVSMMAFTSEVYDTKFRGAAFGIAMGISNAIGIAIPLFIFSLKDQQPFVLFATANMVAFFCSRALPLDTTKSKLSASVVESKMSDEALIY